MLQKFMDMGVYLYTIAGIGVLGLLIMYVINTVSKKTVQDKKTYTRLTRRLNKVTLVSSVLCLAVTAAAMGVGFSMGQAETLGIRYLLIGLGAVFLLVCYGKYLSFSDRERVLGDYLFRLIDQQEPPEAVVKEPPTKEQLIERAMKGIRESAATGENKFSHLLSKEEEDVMREVINEFITQG